MLVDGSTPGNPATLDDAGFWASLYGLTYPVTYGPPAPGITAVPTYYFINSDLTVGSITEGFGGDASVMAAAQALY